MFKAVIFDMDGVLVDSEYWWKIWEVRFLKYLLGCWNKEKQQKIMGRGLKDIHSLLQKEYQCLISWEEFKNKYNQAAKRIYETQVILMPNVRQTLIALKQKGVKIGLASSSFKLWIAMVVGRFKLKKYFDAIVSAEEVGSRGKPAPDIYLWTANKLNIQPAKCLVVEDSTNGILSAKAAGMTVVGYRTKDNQGQDLRLANKIVRDLSAVL